MKKLYKSESDKVIFGVLGGIAEYFEVDVVVVRLFFLFIVFVTGFVPGIIFYFIAGLLVPEKNNGHRKNVKNEAEENDKE